MTEIIVIAAVAENNVIGKNGKIPWYIKEDFQHFKELTMDHPCIMGYRTYESLPVKPLPGRENIVLTFDKSYKKPGITVKNSFDDAIEYCKGKEKVYICGGASVYEQGIKIANKLELTRVHKDYEGDTFFPKVDFSKWDLIKKDDRDGFSFLTYEKKN